MSLPLQAIDRLFLRMGATYGRDFTAKYEGADAMAVKSSWAHELSGFASNLRPIAWALENLPEKTPNVIEFRAICRRAPAPETPRLPEPKADPARVASELAKLGHVREKTDQPHGMKQWAHTLKARHAAGERLNQNKIRCYREALGETE